MYKSNYKKKENKFGIGPSVFGGYSNKGFVYGIGIGLQYNFIWRNLRLPSVGKRLVPVINIIGSKEAFKRSPLPL